MNNRSVILALVLNCLLGLSIQAIYAHAMLEQSEPGAGRILEQSPGMIVLRFDSKLTLPFCQVHIENSRGLRLDDGRISFAGQQENTLQLSLPPLSPGKYHVFWSVVSRDGHRSVGDFYFSIR